MPQPKTRNQTKRRVGGTSNVRPAGRETEAALLAEATTLFATRGYNGTSIADLAGALGVTNAAIYYYVDSKQELLFRVLETPMLHYLAELEAIADKQASAADRVRLAVQNHLNFVFDDRDAAMVFLRERRFLEPPYLKGYDRSVQRYDALFSGLVSDALGDSVRDVDVDVATRVCLGAVSWTLEWYRPDGRLSKDELSDLISELIVTRMLRVDPAPAAVI